MPTNYTALTNGQFATAATFNAPLTELDTAIENLSTGSKALASPDITSFVNSVHTHQDNANGGSLNAAAIGSGTLGNARVNWASPDAIGTGTPNTGRFSALTLENATNPSFIIRSEAGQTRGVYLNTNAAPRWLVYADTAAESGSNAGSNFKIARFNDAGSTLGDALILDRVSGNMIVPAAVNVGGAFDHDGSTIGFYGATPAGKPTITGSKGGNAALTNLLGALAGMGLLTDSTT